MNALLHIRKNVLRATQSELGEIAGTKQGVVSRWEIGELFPDLNQLTAIRSEALRRGLPWDDSWFFEAPSDWNEVREAAE